ncbi:hypothetical protein WG66_007919 [Moniliophthora roreri]|nr:hypothetical protein WG66_007919 [Moniliophthora roreri]
MSAPLRLVLGIGLRLHIHSGSRRATKTMNEAERGGLLLSPSLNPAWSFVHCWRTYSCVELIAYTSCIAFWSPSHLQIDVDSQFVAIKAGLRRDLALAALEPRR